MARKMKIGSNIRVKEIKVGGAPTALYDSMTLTKCTTIRKVGEVLCQQDYSDKGSDSG